MYSPEHFKVTDTAVITAFMLQHSFATIVTHDGEVPHATHMPVLFEPSKGAQGVLVSHIARANPQWRQFEPDREVLVIFTGPHAYISPAWYTTSPAVPTWNYTAVHAYGLPRIVTDPKEFSTMLCDLVDFYEAPRPNRWSAEMSEEFMGRLMKGIVGVEIALTRIEAKFKLSQNRPEDQPGVIAALSASTDQTDRDVAGFMKRTLRTPPKEMMG
jgi:transcriptional regulator